MVRLPCCPHNPTLYRGDCLECGRRVPSVSLRERAKPSHLPLKGSLERGRAKCPGCSDLLVGWWMTMVISPTDYSPNGCLLFEMMNNSQPLLLIGCALPGGRLAREVYQPRRVWTRCKQDETTKWKGVSDGHAWWTRNMAPS